MRNSEVYEAKLSAFSRMLRGEGLSVGPSETADACRILSEFGFENKELMKTALRTVYAKSREEQKIFDRVFDGFFISEEKMRAQAKAQMEREKELEDARAKAEEDIRQQGGPTDLTEEEMNTYVMMPEEVRERLGRIMSTYRQRRIGLENRLYANFIHSVFAKTIMEQQMKMEDAGVGGEEQDPEVGMYYRDISEMTDEDIPKATELIRMLSQRINGELSAKRKKAGTSGKVDFRRTIRKGLETGGSLNRIVRRRSRRKRKQLVVLCDVSGSMIQFSEFALRLIRELGQVSESSRIYLFSEEVVEADAFSLQNMDLFRDYVKSSGLYGRGTDLGTALEGILAQHPPVLNRSVTLLIISDAKTVDQPRAVQDIRLARRLAGQVFWLNPIPESKWKFLTSSRTFAEECPMMSISNLNSLGRAVRKLSAGG